MASIFWDSQRVTMIDYFKQSRTINGAYYEGELRRPRQEIPKRAGTSYSLSRILSQAHAYAIYYDTKYLSIIFTIFIY